MTIKKQEKIHKKLILSKLAVENETSKTVQYVDHLHYKGWEDCDVPETDEAIAAFK